MDADRRLDAIATVAERLLDDLDQITADMTDAAIRAAPALGEDPLVMAEVAASNQANLRRFLTEAARGQGQGDVPPEALDIVRTIVRRGIPTETIFEAYRGGQQAAWRHVMSRVADVAGDRDELIWLLDTVSVALSAYVDQVLHRVLAEAAHERAEILGGALARRTETVRLILDGAPLDLSAASRRLGYDLDRGHVALVLWAEPPGEVQGALETTATRLAQALGGGRCLTIPAGASQLWAWVPTERTPDPVVLRTAMADAEPNVRVVTGPHRRGVTGFRRSHDAALSVHRLLARHPGDALVTFEEIEVTALASEDLAHAAEFVTAALGSLGTADGTARRLRETLRVYLDEADNAPRAAARLHVHRNTVLQRVARAEELLGHRVGERRLAVALALELVHTLGPRLLAAGKRSTGVPPRRPG